MMTIRRRPRLPIALVGFVMLLPASSANASTAAEGDDAYLRSVQQWRDERVARLLQPDGWFSFTGSGVVEPGESSVGSAPDNAIVLPGGPARLGVLTLSDDGTSTFRAEPGAGARIDAKPFVEATLRDNRNAATPTRIDIGDTGTWFYVVRTGDKTGWRFRDPDSAARKAFRTHGMPTWPIDRAWRIEATWEPFDPPRMVDVVSVIGTVTREQVPGRAHFQIEGRRYALQPTADPDGQLFFVFADRTSGRESYGAGRFLYAAPPVDGRVTLDFNQAYNPPCALSGHVVCPVASPENRLDLRIPAGEKKYTAGD